ncbi:MAG TPA: lantibiotic dehydratase, partial [Polyangiaceae bacterium]|nr:lantibiotic dehydratase [Polyangiaceae bacterium]
FGPVAWARCDPEVKDCVLEVGEPLIANHQHFLEAWALLELTTLFANDPEIKLCVPVRRLPPIAIRGEEIKLPLQPPVKREPAVISALEMCDGTRNSKEVARALASQAHGTEEEMLRLLDSLEGEGLVHRRGELPRRYRAERTLRTWLERAPAAVAAPHLARLDRIERALARLDDACGDAGAVIAAINALQDVFHQETGKPGKRGGGVFYEARSPVFQEARRNVKLALGRSVIEDLRESLGVVLLASRWYNQTIAQRTHEHARQIVSAGGGRMEFLQLFMMMGPDLLRIVDEVAQELKQRWARAVHPLREAGRVEVEAARRAVEEHFPRMPILLELARHGSPDLLIAAESAEAIRRGEYQVVLGEMHSAGNTVIQACFMVYHDAMKLGEWSALDVRQVPIIGEWQPVGSSIRGMRPVNVYGAKWIIPHPHGSEWTNDSIVALADLCVELDSAGGLIGRDGSGREFGFADMFNPMLPEYATFGFGLAGTAPHSERLSIGRLIVERERWVTPGETIAPLMAKDRAERFAKLRSWMRREGMPRHVFVRVPQELKPYYMDLHSPLYIDLFTKLVRRLPEPSALVTIVEMLPRPDQLWLTDAEGNAYTSELRCVCVDES